MKHLPVRRPHRPKGVSFFLGTLVILLSSVLLLVQSLFIPPSLAAQSGGPRTTGAQNALHFVVIGDMGSGLPAQKEIAGAMFAHYQRQPFPFVLMLGDNIYPDGDINKYSETRFRQPYSGLLALGVQFYPVLGNHDVLGGHENDMMAYFKMPGRYYTFQKGPIAFFALDSNQFDAAQQQWLDQALTQSRAPWKIAYAHHPIYSSGLHGSSKSLQKTLKPVLEKHKVQLYLTGHDHDYERFASVNGVNYIVSGGGGASIRPFKDKEKGSQVRHVRHHYMAFTVQGNQLTFEVLDGNNRCLDQGVIPLTTPAPQPAGPTR
jgi:3',5'-cyclic AMP phosphodiesterase CpdA